MYILLINVSHKPVISQAAYGGSYGPYCYSGSYSYYSYGSSFSGCSKICTSGYYTDYLWGWTNTCTQECQDSAGNVLSSSGSCSSVTVLPPGEQNWFLVFLNPDVDWYGETAATATASVAALSAVAPPALAMVGPLGLAQPGILSTGGGTLPATAFTVRKVIPSSILVTIRF